MAGLEKETGVKAEYIGIGTPGAHDPILHTHKNSNTTCLNGMPFKLDLAQHLNMEVRMANDANCFAIAEANMGAVRDYFPQGAKVVFGVIMGTGVGGGLVVKGEVWNGRQGIGGEWGHNFLDKSGGKCYCGQVGCVETIISGPALQRYYTSLTSEQRHLKDIFKDVATDPAAKKTKQRLLKFFGKGIASIVNMIDPDVIVIGGGVGNLDCLYTEGVAEVQKNVFNARLDTIFLKPKLGDSAGVFGAALL